MHHVPFRSLKMWGHHSSECEDYQWDISLPSFKTFPSPLHYEKPEPFAYHLPVRSAQGAYFKTATAEKIGSLLIN
jgi:hypothetical protein